MTIFSGRLISALHIEGFRFMPLVALKIKWGSSFWSDPMQVIRNGQTRPELSFFFFTCQAWEKAKTYARWQEELQQHTRLGILPSWNPKSEVSCFESDSSEEACCSSTTRVNDESNLLALPPSFGEREKENPRVSLYTEPKEFLAWDVPQRPLLISPAFLNARRKHCLVIPVRQYSRTLQRTTSRWENSISIVFGVSQNQWLTIQGFALLKMVKCNIFKESVLGSHLHHQHIDRS